MTGQPLRETGGTGLSAIDPAGRRRLDGLFRSEATRLHRFFRRRTRCEETAAEMVQETFLRLAGSSTGRRLENPIPYLQRIARNLLFDRSRSGEARAHALNIDYDDNRDATIGPEQGLLIEARELLARYEEIVATMTPRTRQVFLLHRVDDLTYRQIAQQLDISISTVEYHMTRAIVQLDRLRGQE